VRILLWSRSVSGVNGCDCIHIPKAGITPSKQCSSAPLPEVRCCVQTVVEPGTPRVGGRWSASTAPGQARALQQGQGAVVGVRTGRRRAKGIAGIAMPHVWLGTISPRLANTSASYYGNRRRAFSRLPIESVATLGFMCEEVRYRSVGILDKLVGAQQTRSKHRFGEWDHQQMALAIQVSEELTVGY